MLIYKVVNKINSKIYIGQTVRSLEQRIISHLSDAKLVNDNSFLHRSIIKYGKENFEWEELEKCGSQDELNIREKYWIEKLNTLAPNGYNLQTGGHYFFHHEETKLKISNAIKGRVPWNKGKKGLQKAWNKGRERSEETCKKISETRKGRFTGEDNHFYGRKHTEESKRKMSESSKGKIPWNKGKKLK